MIVNLLNYSSNNMRMLSKYLMMDKNSEILNLLKANLVR